MTLIRRMVAVGYLVDHNRWRLDAFRRLGLDVTYLHTGGGGRALSGLDHRLGISPHHELVRRRLRRLVRSRKPDVVWVDKGLFFRAEDVEMWKKDARLVVHTNPDDWLNPIHQWHSYRNAVPAYDAHFVTRPANVAELRLQGARHVVKTWFAFEPSIHRASGLAATLGECVFVGRSDPDRVSLLAHLAETGHAVRAFGPGYEDLRSSPNCRVDARQPLGADYARVLEAAGASLGLLARQSRDQHTCRSLEIPACGGLLVGERTPEHQDLFEDNKEALFFDSQAELVERLNEALNKNRNEQICRAGHARALASGYDHLSRAREAIVILESLLT